MHEKWPAAHNCYSKQLWTAGLGAGDCPLIFPDSLLVPPFATELGFEEFAECCKCLVCFLIALQNTRVILTLFDRFSVGCLGSCPIRFRKQNFVHPSRVRFGQQEQSQTLSFQTRDEMLNVFFVTKSFVPNLDQNEIFVSHHSSGHTIPAEDELKRRHAYGRFRL